MPLFHEYRSAGMEDWVVKILFVIFGLYSGVMSWLFRTVWNDLKHAKDEIKNMHEEMIELRSSNLLQIREQIDERFAGMERLIETKMNEGFTKLELMWINEGRLQPKRRITSNNKK
jgi:hypothetical protein